MTTEPQKTEGNVKYSQGKVYKIIAETDEEYTPYIGSTTQPLSKRMGDHRDGYKAYKNGKKNYTSSFALFEKYGVENCKIILIELYPCSSKEELQMREQFYLDEVKNCNKYKAFRSEEQKREYQKGLDQVKRSSMEYIEKVNEPDFKEKEKERLKKHYEENKEKFLQRANNNYQQNKEKILARQQQKVTCECGVICSKGNLPAHRKSQQHMTNS